MLDGPPLPHDAAHIWAWFADLNAARGSNGWGPSAISYQDIVAWVKLTGTITRPPEITALLLLDRLWLAEQRKVMEASRKIKGG